MVIIDGKHLVIFKKPPTRPFRLADRPLCLEDTIYSNDTKFVASMKAVFEGVWNASIDARSRIREITVGKSVEKMEILRDSDELYAYVNEKLRSIKYDGLALVSKWGLVRANLYPVEELTKRGVKVRLLGFIDRDNVEAVKDLLARGCMVRHSSWPTFIQYMIMDSKEIVLIDFEKDLPSKGNLKIKTAIVSNQKAFVSTQSKLIEDLWDTGLDAQTRITQLETGELGTIEKPALELLKQKSTKV